MTAARPRLRVPADPRRYSVLICSGERQGLWSRYCTVGAAIAAARSLRKHGFDARPFTASGDAIPVTEGGP